MPIGVRVNRQLQWSQAALGDLQRLQTWAEKNRAATAPQLAAHLLASTEKLLDLPRVGRRIPVPDGGNEELRELLARPFVIRYVLTPDAVQIVRCWHYRENRPGFESTETSE